MIALDSETTGVDFHHGAKPFLVTTCTDDGSQRFWEWFVNPLTREPDVDEDAADEISAALAEHDRIAMQNAKFDVAALNTVFPDIAQNWRWQDTREMLLAAHLLESNMPKDLTYLSGRWLGVPLLKYEKAVEKATKEARTIAAREFPRWRLARKGMADMPSAKGDDKKKKSQGLGGSSPWKLDMWLPRLIAREKRYPKDHPWWTVTSQYANADSSVTVMLAKVMLQELHRRKLWKIYLERLKVLPITYDMEQQGVTVSKTRLRTLKTTYMERSKQNAAKCVNIAASCGYELEMPKGSGVNDSLRRFCFDVLKLEHVRNPKAKTDKPTLDSKNAMAHYLVTLPRKSKQLRFCQLLSSKRKVDTSVSYLQAYERFWLPMAMDGQRFAQMSAPQRINAIRKLEWFVLHPSLNPTGTDTLRWSCANPNGQNISKKEDAQGSNVRFAFGPEDGWEWWSMDAKNIELRIPAYTCPNGGEKEMIALFERPNDAPYYGSNHLLVSHILYPKEFEACRNKDGEIDGRLFKEKYDDSLYQWIKNGNFAVQYGAMEESGTADRAYHVSGGQRKVQRRFRNIKLLNDWCIDFANEHGYIETVPDVSVDPRRGYPLICTRTDYGRIKPTVPLNYRVQGTAMWWTMKAMIRCWEQILKWRREGIECRIVMQVHDEILFAFRKAANPITDPKRSNLGKAKTLQALMAKGGDDICVPTPVSIKWHPNNWKEGMSV